MTDKRPDPKPRKNAELWQYYLIWHELMEMRKEHSNRISSIEAGKSNFELGIEQTYFKDIQLDEMVKHYRDLLHLKAEELGGVWDWIISIRGLGEGNLAAQVLAQIDDIAKFDNISKLWRFAGYAVINGKREYNQPGEKSHYNRTLKSLCWVVTDQFIKQHTPFYDDLYRDEKAKLRLLHPEKVVENGKTRYNDGHIDKMARRKVSKVFLSHLWLKWRESDGLPVTEPYVNAILGHRTVSPDEVSSLVV